MTFSNLISILRVRLRSAESESDLSERDLVLIGRTTLGLSSDLADNQVHADIYRADLPTLEDNRRIEAERLAEKLVGVFRGARDVIIDARIVLPPRPGPLEAAISYAWKSARSELTADHRVLVLVDKRLRKTHMWLREMIDDLSGGTVVILDSRGGAEGTLELSPETMAAATPSAEDYRSLVEERLIRRRGVFRGLPSRPGEFLHYRYSIEASGKRALKLAIRLYLERLASRHKIVVVFDAPISPWLEEGVLAACASLGIHAHRLDSLEGLETSESGRAIRDAINHAERVVLVTPLLKSGRTLENAHAAITGVRNVIVRVLCVAFDRRRGSPDDTESGSGVRSAQFPVGDQRLKVDYLADATQEILASTDWRLVSAVGANAIEDGSAEWVEPSAIGMWSLISELGFGEEHPVPAGRRKVSSFPRLQGLETRPMDALWLAESLVRLAEREAGCSRAEMLMIFPEEDSGARPIAMAVENRLAVPVLRVERRVFEGGAPLDASSTSLLGTYRRRGIVLADESTVSYSTMRALNDLCQNVTGTGADAGVVVLDLGTYEQSRHRPVWLSSLYSWRTITQEAM